MNFPALQAINLVCSLRSGHLALAGVNLAGVARGSRRVFTITNAPNIRQADLFSMCSTSVALGGHFSGNVYFVVTAFPCCPPLPSDLGATVNALPAVTCDNACLIPARRPR